jgi:hypothetical protein
MAHLDVTSHTAPVAGIAEPHQSTVAAILRAAQLGLFTETEASSLINRVRTHVTTFPLSIEDSRPATGSGRTWSVVSIRPDKTDS